MPAKANTIVPPDPIPDPAYDPFALFHPSHAPLHPGFITEAVRTLIRTLPLDPAEPAAAANRRIDAALRSLAALHPRDEIEVLLAVQALAACHAAAATWRLGMNRTRPHGDSPRHVSVAATAARTFDAMLKALERRQARPLAPPLGRPPATTWPAEDPATRVEAFAQRCNPEPTPAPRDTPVPAWSAADRETAETLREQERIAAENAGLDLENTAGILPGGGMIVPADPTPQQEAYLARRHGLRLKREYDEIRRQGGTHLPKLRPIRTGDLIP